jgi:peptide-methionine (S)-S-oxide reductase
LWFVAEDPVRADTLPPNICRMAEAIIAVTVAHRPDLLAAQLDHALSLVAWSWVAARCGVQLELIDTLIDAGAVPGERAHQALVNRHVPAAERLIARGGTLTLAAALCLGHWDAVPRLHANAAAGERQFALILAALNGNASALEWMLAHGADVNAPSAELYSHGTPLHHAVSSGSLAAVRVLVEAGADLTLKDSAWGGTPLGWAHHYVLERGPVGDTEYPAIMALLEGAIPR